MENVKAIYVSAVTVTDPDTGAEIDVEIYKDEASGAMFGLDSSFLDGDVGPVFSPYNKGQEITIPNDDEE
jgi:hypothetical protein